jgi:hypothetical protein
MPKSFIESRQAGEKHSYPWLGSTALLQTFQLHTAPLSLFQP